MNIDIYIKDKEGYSLRRFELDNNSKSETFKKLLLLVNKELENIKNDFIKIDPDVNLKIPHSNNKIKSEKLRVLNTIRKNNILMKERLTELNKADNYIICEHCNHKMYLKPVGVNFEKVGNKYINLTDRIPDTYIYSCENCVFAVDKVLVDNDKIEKSKHL